MADSEVAPDEGVRPGVQDLGSDRGADVLSLDGGTLSEAEEGGFSGSVDRPGSKGGFLVERILRFFYDFLSFQTLTGWLQMALRLLPLVWVKMVLRVLMKKTFRYV